MNDSNDYLHNLVTIAAMYNPFECLPDAGCLS